MCKILNEQEVKPEAKRLRYRMGIHLGDVLVEGDDLVGDGVNIAARLEGIAAPGGVLISRTAYENVVGRLEARLTDFGEKALKNIAHPVHVYAVAPDNPTYLAQRARILEGMRTRAGRLFANPTLSPVTPKRPVHQSGEMFQRDRQPRRGTIRSAAPPSTR